jgi:hypothetical protein
MDERIRFVARLLKGQWCGLLHLPVEPHPALGLSSVLPLSYRFRRAHQIIPTALNY